MYNFKYARHTFRRHHTTWAAALFCVLRHFSRSLLKLDKFLLRWSLFMFVFWIVTPYNFVGGYELFMGTWILCLRVQDGAGWLFSKRYHLLGYIVSSQKTTWKFVLSWAFITADQLPVGMCVAEILSEVACFIHRSKVKVKFTLEQDMKAQRGSRGRIALLFP
jgi:hypothetical protein